ncbi:MAG TPA: WbuC family cupin fold metalloprotein [Chloroflexia bacterium]|nr:WbuC family cupin fold metalloprotein [Chloroflexia bacterium]
MPTGIMSRPYLRNPDDPLALVLLDESLLDEAASEAEVSPRRRSIIRFHEHADVLQRMLNAIEPESYARPHQHRDPDKAEVFVALRGRVLMVRFAEDGAPIEGSVVSAGGPVKGIEVPAGVWHCLLSLEEGTVLFEVKEGPYDPATDKRFAPWSPPEEDLEAGLAFMARLRAHFSALIPELSARDLLEAEEDDIC